MRKVCWSLLPAPAKSNGGWCRCWLFISERPSVRLHETHVTGLLWSHLTRSPNWPPGWPKWADICYIYFFGSSGQGLWSLQGNFVQLSTRDFRHQQMYFSLEHKSYLSHSPPWTRTVSVEQAYNRLSHLAKNCLPGIHNLLENAGQNTCNLPVFWDKTWLEEMPCHIRIPKCWIPWLYQGNLS